MNKDTLQAAKTLVTNIDLCTSILDTIAELREDESYKIEFSLVNRKGREVYQDLTFVMPDSAVIELERITRHSLATYEAEFAAL